MLAIDARRRPRRLSRVSISLPILMLPIAAQRYSCHGCGNCCRDFTVQLREADLAKLRAQDWETKLAMPVTVEINCAISIPGAAFEP